MIKEQPNAPICKICQKNTGRRGAVNKLGFQLYKKICRRCEVIKHEPSKAYIFYKKDHCELCPFIAVHPCQLDVDHIDGNHANNDPLNLQTLCACCHRLKTWTNRDNIKF